MTKVPRRVVVALYDRWSYDACLGLSRRDARAAVPSARPSHRVLALIACLASEPTPHELRRLLDAGGEDMAAADGRTCLRAFGVIRSPEWLDLAGGMADALEAGCGTCGSSPRPIITRLPGACGLEGILTSACRMLRSVGSME